MDTLTHGLLGAALGALRLPRWLVARDDSRESTRAGVLVSVLAAELPDIDYLFPAADPVLHALKAHRGMTHALLAAPVVALAAAVLAKLIFQRVRMLPLYARALLTVPLAHLLPDLWTGWGTRLLLPFTDRRVALDWTMVVDPLFTGPMLVATGWALWRRGRWRRTLFVGVACSALYLGARVALANHLGTVVRSAYPSAAAVHVFPAPLAVTRWRYVVRTELGYAAGSVALGKQAKEEARVTSFPGGPLPPALASVPTVREALAWARFPVVRFASGAPGEVRVEVADLRYHLRGEPTLTFVVTVAENGTVRRAQLDRGGTVGQLVRRLRP